MVKKKNKESSPAVNISTDLKKTEETTTTPISSHVSVPPAMASKKSRENLKKKLKIVKMIRSNTILIISMSTHFPIKEKHKTWIGKLVHSKETEGDIALLTIGKQERPEAIRMRLKRKLREMTKSRIEIITEMKKITSIEKRNLILKMLREVLVNIELEELVENGSMSHKSIKMILIEMRSIHSGERTGAHGLEQKPSEVTVVAIGLMVVAIGLTVVAIGLTVVAIGLTVITIGLTIMIMKVLMKSNLKEDKSTDLENPEEVMTVIKNKLMMMILPKDKSLTPKQVNQ